jgi:hypothetical protein
VPLNQVLFVTSPKWYVLQRIAVEGDVLVFRKYAFSVIDGKIAGVERTKNIFDFGCQRNNRYSDYIVFHFPNWAGTGLEGETWKPRLPLKIALNELHLTFDAEGEYKNSSLFVDLDRQQLQPLLKLMTADDMIIDYGVPEGRLTVQQRTLTPDGKGNVVGFLGDFVTNILSPSIKAGKVTSFDTDGVLKACMTYKQRGRLP